MINVLKPKYVNQALFFSEKIQDIYLDVLWILIKILIIKNGNKTYMKKQILATI